MQFTRRTTSGTRVAGIMSCDGAQRRRSLLALCYMLLGSTGGFVRRCQVEYGDIYLLMPSKGFVCVKVHFFGAPLPSPSSSQQKCDKWRCVTEAPTCPRLARTAIATWAELAT
jgi:hypothetical protein